ncbi:hypothetical protein BaRGS_00009483 [Batillaria attramentaria]|uniref:RRM domain-containing protein n=1 Tax=Batillaria attramentaria TaxID=370345 RepID=A0ABD0LII3_9CAEN
MDPSRNNMPLEFNRSKGKPPKVYTRNDTEDVDGEDVISSTASAAAIAAATAAASSTNTIMTNSQYNMAHLANSSMEMGPADNSMGSGMVGSLMGTVGPMGPNMMMGPVNMGQKEVITLESCVLYPPHPDAPPHSVRERPPGCRTAFVGGLPENITEEILHEVFERSGPIETIRLGKKNFAHIRFINQDSVEQAMYLSGYRMKIENKDDKPNTGRLHVDYANARNDQHEWECEQRALAREMRHQQQLQDECMRVPSPPPVAPFTVYDGNALLEVIKSDTGFMQGSQQLITWLDRGSVDKRSSSLFYSLIQSSNTHVRRLITEKQQYEEEVNQAKLLFKQRVQGILVQLGQIEHIFAATRKQKNWDHFTKAQRKNIDTWYKQVQEVKESQQAEFLKERTEDEMELSDTEPEPEGPSSKKRKPNSEGVQLSALKEENDSLKCQLEAYVNEAEMVKVESKQNTEALERQITSLQNALKGMQQQLIAQQAQARRSLSQENSKSTMPDNQEHESSSRETRDREDNDVIFVTSEKVVNVASAGRSQDSAITSSGVNLSEKEARMMGLIACFLNVHPHGATVDYLWSYLSQMMTVKPREIEDLLDRLPCLFRQDLAGCGATLERRWCFVGFQKEKSSAT